MASPFSANAAFLSRYAARELRTDLDVPVLEIDFESRMPALVSDSDDSDTDNVTSVTEPRFGHNSDHDSIYSFQSDGADGTYFPSYEIPDFDRETGDLGGEGFNFFTKLSIQVTSRRPFPAMTRTLEKFQLPSAATAT